MKAHLALGEAGLLTALALAGSVGSTSLAASSPPLPPPSPLAALVDATRMHMSAQSLLSCRTFRLQELAA